MDKSGKLVPVYIKVIPEYKSKSYYTLPTFVNKGFIERCYDKKPSIELTPDEKANIELKSRKGASATEGKTTGSPIQQDEIDDEIKSLVQ